jgi:hypothetical protein
MVTFGEIFLLGTAKVSSTERNGVQFKFTSLFALSLFTQPAGHAHIIPFNTPAYFQLIRLNCFGLSLTSTKTLDEHPS